MTNIVDEFLNFHAKYNNVTAQHAQQMGRVLEMLSEFLSPRDILDITARDFEEFLVSREVSANTIQHYVAYCRPFFLWLHRHEMISDSQYLHLAQVKSPRGAGQGSPRPYSKRELDKVWEALDERWPWTGDEERIDHRPSRGEYWVERWLEKPHDAYLTRMMLPYARRLQVEAIVALALYGGMRKGEIFRLTLDDCHHTHAYVRCMGAKKNLKKEYKERVIPMSEPLRVALANWQEFRAQVLRPDGDTLWLTLWFPDIYKPISWRSFGRTMEGFGELHRLRHTFATHRVRAGMKVPNVQKLLGHQNIAMTLRYAQISDEDVLDDARSTNTKFEAALNRATP